MSNLICGVALNDAGYVTNKSVDGVQVRCPFYAKWYTMITRCYNGKKPAYKDCIVCDEWLTFSNFKSWMEKQDWEEKQIDKDIIEPGNNVYCPELCCFVSRKLNMLLCAGNKAGGAYLTGVAKHKKGSSVFESKISINGKQIRIGFFDKEIDAHIAWKKAKSKLLVDEASKQSDLRIAAGLMKHAELLNA